MLYVYVEDSREWGRGHDFDLSGSWPGLQYAQWRLIPCMLRASEPAPLSRPTTFKQGKQAKSTAVSALLLVCFRVLSWAKAAARGGRCGAAGVFGSGG